MKLTRNPLFLIGMIFTILGAIFTVIGVGIFASFYHNGGSMTVNGRPVHYAPGQIGGGMVAFLGIFGGIGILFIILGVIFLIISNNRYKNVKALLDNGQYVTARVIDIVRNHNVRINGVHPYNIICQYDDNYGGAPHVFKSDNILHHPGDILDYSIKVYVNKSNWDMYYVDETSLTTPSTFY